MYAQNCTEFTVINDVWHNYDNTIVFALCALPCPLPYYSENQWKSIYYINVILSSISLAVIIILLILLLLSKSSRAFPANLIINQQLGVLISYIFIVTFAVTRPYPNFYCYDEYNLLTSLINNFCKVQGQ
eukprot:TRINITY_DN1616_c1_g2_i1.p1 TRINITY_DN1616_c1_g2~~TRINITY_DN1616_c1_g2_i1.p1  ORF type:complete len:130 (-),score=19.09 TRINITY_DN1616_c1_g2_i1:32-421(-)